MKEWEEANRPDTNFFGGSQVGARELSPPTPLPGQAHRKLASGVTTKQRKLHNLLQPCQKQLL